MSQKDPLLPVYPRASGLAFEAGAGVRLTDTHATTYLDFAAGIAVNILGHAHPHLTARLHAAIDAPWHLSNLYDIPGQTRLAARLLAHAPFASRVFFANSGSEAVECAVKIARRRHYHAGNPQRQEILAFAGAFHGRTLATIAAGGRAKYMEGFGDPAPGFRSLPFGDLAAVESALSADTAAILAEPIQGEGGIRAWDTADLRRLRAICDNHGALLILDEVQSGMGRSGDFFAHEQSGIAPDIVAMAKGLGGGFPIGACLASEHAAAGMGAGSHGSTFGGNPLAMAAGEAVLDIVETPDFLPHIRAMAGELDHGLRQLQQRHGDIVSELRGRGLMRGLRCVPPAKTLVAAAQARGLLTVGADDNVVRLLPPLIVESSDIAEALAILQDACRHLSEQAEKKTP